MIPDWDLLLQDLSDSQWKQLRESAFGLGTTAVLFLISSRAVSGTTGATLPLVTARKPHPVRSKSAFAAQVACFAAEHRLQFYALSGTVYAGNSVIQIIAVASFAALQGTLDEEDIGWGCPGCGVVLLPRYPAVQ